MRKTFLVLCVFLIFGLLGCEGPVGEKGERGDPGGTVTEYTGYIPGDGTNGLVDIGGGPLPSKTAVTVYFAFPSLPNAWCELGQPTGDNSILRDPWCAVDYRNADVWFYNCSTTWLYKIIVFTPTSSSAFVNPFGYLFGD